MRKKRINQKAVIGIFIAAIMVLSIFGMMLDYAIKPDQKIKYKEYTFKQKQGKWTAEIKDKEYKFYFTPQDLEHLNITQQAKQLLKTKDVYTITYDPDNRDVETIAQAIYELEQQITKPIIETALTNNTGTALLQKTCKDATPQQPVIYYKEGDEQKIETQKNCIIINSIDSRDIIMQTDLIKYLMLGVMK